jgi:hypothetical protein
MLMTLSVVWFPLFMFISGLPRLRVERLEI